MTLQEVIRLGTMLVGDRAPDEIINDTVDGEEIPYLCRWFVRPREDGKGNIYLHLFLRSDFDRALHDHPWASTSILLCGEYLEHLADGRVMHRKAGDIVMREATDAHRIELINGTPTWSLFITGPKVRSWGFHCAEGWTHWRDFVANKCGG